MSAFRGKAAVGDRRIDVRLVSFSDINISDWFNELVDRGTTADAGEAPPKKSHQTYLAFILENTKLDYSNIMIGD